MENNNISQIERNHFIQKVDWIESEIIGSGLTLSVNKTVIPAQYKTKLNEFNPENSINELIRFGFEKQVNIELLRIASLYLSANVKSRAINTEHSMNILFDYIIEDCGNLELQEINFIFRNGIIGKFGVIFNDISIDTICGVGGWIETYYKDFRKLREEPTKVQNVKLRGKEITEAEFLERNPEFKERVRLRQLLELAKGGKITSEHAKEFYKLKGLTLDDVKEDMTVYSHNYFALPESQRELFTESQFINHQHCKFIIQNIFKNKK